MGQQPGERTSDHGALISVAQAAALLGVHPNTVRAWSEDGRLAAYRINARGDRRFRRADVERLLVEGAEADGEGADHGSQPRDAHLSVLARLASGAAAATTAAVCRVALQALRTDIGYARAAVYLEAGGELVIETHAGYRLAPAARRSLPPDAAETPEVVTSDAHAVTVELPLRAGRDVLGLLIIEDEPGGALNESQLPFLRTVAAALAAAVRNVRLLTRARREVQRARALRRVTQELTGQLDLATVLDEIVERTRSLFDADKAGFWLLESGAHPFRLAANRGLGEQFTAQVRQLTIESPTLGSRAVREHRSFWMRNAGTDPEIGLLREAYAAEGIRTVCLVPLVANDEALGLIGLYHQRDRTWPDEEVALVQAFANQAAVAIQNARLYRSVADQAARIRSIQDLSVSLNRLTDVRAIAEAIVTEATALADYHDIRVYTVDWERRVCDAVAFTRDMLGDDPQDAAERLRVEIGEGFTGWVAEHGEPILVNDAMDDPRGKTIDGTDDIDESLLVVPMLYEGRTLGVIVLSQLGFNRFTADDLQTMTIFAGQAAQAMANAAAYERLAEQSGELARRVDSQRRLLEINARLLSTLDQASVLETIADGLRDVVSYDNLSVYRADYQRRAMLPMLARERHAEHVSRYIIPFGRGLMGWAVAHAQPLLINDALADPRALQIPGTWADPEAVIVVPLVAEGEVLGALNVSRVGGPEVHFSPNDFELVQLFAAQASLALRNADTHHAVSQRAETDALTGLGNHGAFQLDLGRLLEHTDGGRVAMLMMDLDRFKAYNDRHGHPAGDALLHAAGTAIYGAARSDDRVYRYGGDEFALILPGATPAAAARVGERIQRAVRALTTGNPTLVTITIGVAGYPQDAADRAGLVAAADTALYYGKQAGGDRTVRADEVPEDMRALRGALDELARTALQRADEPGAVGQLVEQAAALTGPHEEQADSMRDALLMVARSLDARDPATRGHVDRVGRLAMRLAERVGLDTEAARTIELAARLHVVEDLGATGLDPVPSLHGVGDLLQGYRALRAGSRGGRRRGRSALLGAHLVAVADGYDELIAGIGGPRVGRTDAVERLRRDPVGYRPEVLDALREVVAGRADRGSRRRRNDVGAEAMGAA